MFVIIAHDVKVMFSKEGGGARLNGSNVVLLYGSYYVLWMCDLWGRTAAQNREICFKL